MWANEPKEGAKKKTKTKQQQQQKLMAAKPGLYRKDKQGWKELDWECSRA